MSNGKYIAILIIVGLVLVVGAIMIGKSDSGEIDVNQAIESANKANIDAGNTGNMVNTTPKNLRDLPNGGLVPQDSNAVPPTPEPEPKVEEENASSTDEIEQSDGDSQDMNETDEDTAGADTPEIENPEETI